MPHLSPSSKTLSVQGTRKQAAIGLGVIVGAGALITAGVAATMLGQPEIGAPLIAMSAF